MPTSVPPVTFGPNGVIVPAESAVLAGVQSDLNGAFGGNLNPGLTTPQGQLASSETAIVGDKNAQLLFLASQFDPAQASGRFQDGIGNIYFLQRIPSAPTTTNIACGGLVNVVIPVGALVQAEDGNQYACSAPGTIPAGGSITLPFECTTNGPIACPAQAFTIYRAIPGWDTAVSALDGVEGNNTETQAEYELRRQQSVALNAVSMTQAIQANVLAVPGVIDAYTIDNPTSSAATIGGVSLLANSTYICVSGGLASAVAQAIFLKRAPGSPFAGTSITQTVYDTSNGYVAPYPAYQISWQTPTSVPIYWAVSIVNSAAVPSTAQAQVAAAIQSAFLGQDGGPRARIGSELFALRYYGVISALGPWAQVVSIYIGQAASPAGTTTTLNINQIPTFNAADVTVTLV